MAEWLADIIKHEQMLGPITLRLCSHCSLNVAPVNFETRANFSESAYTLCLSCTVISEW